MEQPNAQITYRHAKTSRDFEVAKALFIEYGQSLHMDLSFQNFDDELNELPKRYGGSTGDLILAYVDQQLAGGIAIHRFESGVAEMKRLYVRTQFRSLGLGHELVARILASAQSMGYKTVRLDTIPQMKAAQKIYREAGFKKIAPYRYNPVAGTIYLECSLGE